MTTQRNDSRTSGMGQSGAAERFDNTTESGAGQSEGVREAATQVAQDATDRAKEMSGHATDRAKDVAQDATDRATQMADTGMDQAAGGVERAADAIRERMDSGAAVKVADGMERTADYLRSHEPGDVVGDLEHYVREHPIQGTVAAVAVGFVIGRLLR